MKYSISVVSEVFWKSKVDKQLKKVPERITLKFYAWVTAVELGGLSEVKESPGFRDEPLKGKRVGQRSIRLNKAYRAIYIERNKKLEIIEVIEVNKHEY